MKKIFTLLSMVAISTAFGQMEYMQANDVLTSPVQVSSSSATADEEQTFSQISSDDLSASVSILSCSSLTSPIQLSRGYDMVADYGLNSPFTVTKINVAGRPYPSSTLEGMLFEYTGSSLDQDVLALDDLVNLSDNAYGVLSFAASENAQWYDLELYEPYTVAPGTKFLTSLVYTASGTANAWANSFLPWVNNEGTTQTRPSWFGGPLGLCSVPGSDGAPTNHLDQFPAIGVYLMKVTGTADDLGIVELGGNELSVAPNPATSEVTIALKGSKIAKVEVADVTGRVIPLKASLNGKVNISNLSAGVYFLRVQDDKGVTRIQKIIKK